MKKVILVSVAFIALSTAYSQTGKGKKFVGGQFNLSGFTNNGLDTLRKWDEKVFAFQINPGFGYFIKDNILIGVTAKFGLVNRNSHYEYEVSSYPANWTNNISAISYGGGVFARYYKKIVGNFSCFMKGEASYITQTEKHKLASDDPTYIFPSYNPSNQEVQSKTLAFSASPGLVYFMTPKLGIETTFGTIQYSNYTSENKTLAYENHYNTSGFGLNLNMTTFYCGLNYHF